MKITIDTDRSTLSVLNSDGGANQEYPLYSDAAFSILSRQWVKVGWNQKYSYTFSWLGRPIIQLPEDMVRTQEVLFKLQPDVIIETGVAHGGSLIFYASLCRLMGRGRVVGVDITIRPHNRKAIEEHPLSSLITLVEGSSVDPSLVARVGSLIRPGEKVMVILDSCHTRAHVLEELKAYAGFVTPGSFLVATDGIMFDLGDVPLGKPEWTQDNPVTATEDFLGTNSDFKRVEPVWPFNESTLKERVTHWPQAWLQRVR